MSQEFPFETMPHPTPVTRKTEGIAAAETQETKEREARARDICQLGDYQKILDTFAKPENAGLLEEAIARIKQEPTLSEAIPSLAEGDWEMLTILELYDHPTFEHCTRTYGIAKQKIESGSPVGEYLRSEIAKEGLTPWDIEYACLFHDMGKIILTPKKDTLNNTLWDKDWHRLFEAFCHDTYDETEAAERIREYNEQLRTTPGLREKHITPIKVSLSPEDRARLEAQGVDTELPLAALIERHQDVSVEIVARYHQDSSLLDLIGNHHRKALAKDEARPVSQSTVRLSSSVDILRLSDVFDACRSDRPYKKGMSLFGALAVLIEESRLGFTDPELTRLWIQEELASFDTTGYLQNLRKNNAENLVQEEVAHEVVEEFLLPPLKQAA